ncbi:MAG: hypothetical protein ACFFAN_05275 [Promethearchaeota archaeon]
MEAIKKLIKIDNIIHIIAISALEQESSVLEAVKKGVMDYIQKPFKKDVVS